MIVDRQNNDPDYLTFSYWDKTNLVHSMSHYCGRKVRSHIVIEVLDIILLLLLLFSSEAFITPYNYQNSEEIISSISCVCLKRGRFVLREKYKLRAAATTLAYTWLYRGK